MVSLLVSVQDDVFFNLKVIEYGTNVSPLCKQSSISWKVEKVPGFKSRYDLIIYDPMFKETKEFISVYKRVP